MTIRAVIDWIAVTGIMAAIIGPFVAPLIVELARLIRRK